MRILATLLFTTLISINTTAAETTPLPESPLTAGFDHVGLTVQDLEASTKFFTEVLVWKKVGGDPKYPANFVTDGKMFLTLWAIQNKEEAVSFNRKTNVGLHHLAFAVDSFEVLEKIYQQAKVFPGVVIEFAPEPAYGGPAKHMILREPSGNRLEFKHSPK